MKSSDDENNVSETTVGHALLDTSSGYSDEEKRRKLHMEKQEKR